MTKELTQEVFKGQPPEVVIACVDFDGLLKFGDKTSIRYTWASERWRGANWISEVEGTPYKPLTSLVRQTKPKCINWPHNHAANGCG